MQWIKCVCNVFPVACQFPARITICWYRFLINKLCDPTLLQAVVCLLLLIRGYCQSFVMCAESCSQDFMSWHCCLLHGMISRKRRRGKGDIVRIRSVVHSNTQPYTNTHTHTYIYTYKLTHLHTHTNMHMWMHSHVHAHIFRHKHKTMRTGKQKLQQHPTHPRHPRQGVPPRWRADPESP